MSILQYSRVSKATWRNNVGKSGNMASLVLLLRWSLLTSHTVRLSMCGGTEPRISLHQEKKSHFSVAGRRMDP